MSGTKIVQKNPQVWSSKGLIIFPIRLKEEDSQKKGLYDDGFSLQVWWMKKSSSCGIQKEAERPASSTVS